MNKEIKLAMLAWILSGLMGSYIGLFYGPIKHNKITRMDVVAVATIGMLGGPGTLIISIAAAAYDSLEMHRCAYNCNK